MSFLLMKPRFSKYVLSFFPGLCLLVVIFDIDIDIVQLELWGGIRPR